MAKLDEFKTLNEVELSAVEGGDRNSYNAGWLLGGLINNFLYPGAPIVFLPYR